MAVIAYCEKALVYEAAKNRYGCGLPATTGGETLLVYQVGKRAGVPCYKVWTDTVSFTGLDLGATWFSTSLDEAETRWKGNTEIYPAAVKECRDQIIDGGTLSKCKDPANEGKLFVLDAGKNQKIVANPLKV